MGDGSFVNDFDCAERSGYAQCGFEKLLYRPALLLANAVALGLNLLNKPTKQSFGGCQAQRFWLAIQPALLIDFVGHSILIKV